MTNKAILVVSVIAVLIVGYFIFNKGIGSKIVMPVTSFNKADIPNLTLTPSQPKVIQYSSDTDLKKELDKVNPEVEDTDFNKLPTP